MELGYQIVDVSLTLNHEALVFPGDIAPRVDGPYSFVSGVNREFVHRLLLSSQSGTHIQGQHYFMSEGKAIDEYPLERFEGPAVVVECRETNRLDVPLMERALPMADLASLMILFRTCFTTTLLARQARRGGQLLAEDLLDKPGLTLEGARFLLDRGVRFLGIDSVGFEPYPTRDHVINRLLCVGDVLLLENLKGLDLLPNVGGWLECFPLPLSGVEGTPCRAVVKIPRVVATEV